MKSIFKPLAFIVSFALVGSMVTTASAETQWERNHPRRDQVNDRLANQNRRINDELKEGESTNNKPISSIAKIMRSGMRSERCPNSATDTSRGPIRKRSISRKTPSAVKSGNDDSAFGRMEGI